MTEAEWLACDEPDATFSVYCLRGTGGTVRKARLLANASSRRLASCLPPETQETRDAFLKTMEQLVEDKPTDNWFSAIENDEECAHNYEAVAGCAEVAENYTFMIPYMGLAGCLTNAVCNSIVNEPRTEAKIQSSLVRCIFGNPFRPVTFGPTWRTETAVALARQMYESRDFSAMPILADALQDVGCECDEVLTHCRDPKGIHVRGCWVVDLVLGKS